MALVTTGTELSLIRDLYRQLFYCYIEHVTKWLNGCMQKYNITLEIYPADKPLLANHPIVFDPHST